jgi:hypothetical protein
MLNEFSWAKEETEDTFRHGEALDCLIGITPEGKYMIADHANITKTQTFDNAEELGEALSKILAERASR